MKIIKYFENIFMKNRWLDFEKFKWFIGMWINQN